MVRARFQYAVWKMMNPDAELCELNDILASNTYYRYRDSAIRFCHLEAKGLALRRILSDQTLLDKLFETSENMLQVVNALL
jgi:hypothetical protein